MRIFYLVLVALALGPVQPFSHSATEPPAGEGVIVESIAPDSIAAKASLKVGDRLLSYDGKPLRSPATLQACQQNTFEKLTVELRLRRGEETLTLTVPLGALGMEVRPDLPPAARILYEQANPSRDGDGAVTLYSAAAKAAQEAGDRAAAAWLYGRVGAQLTGRCP